MFYGKSHVVQFCSCARSYFVQYRKVSLSQDEFVVYRSTHWDHVISQNIDTLDTAFKTTKDHVHGAEKQRTRNTTTLEPKRKGTLFKVSCISLQAASAWTIRTRILHCSFRVRTVCSRTICSRLVRDQTSRRGVGK